jgi:hypothetical protein
MILMRQYGSALQDSPRPSSPYAGLFADRGGLLVDRHRVVLALRRIALSSERST